MEINVLIDESLETHIETDWFGSIVERALTAQQAPPNVELGLLVTTQEKIRELNKTYLGSDQPTDVIAFYMLPEEDSGGEEHPSFITPPDGITHLGEIVVSYPQAVIQAAEQQHSIRKELAILIIHGVLHILGYRDDTPELKQAMHAREMEILDTIGGDQL